MKVNWKFYQIHYQFLLVLTLLSAGVYWWGWAISTSDGMAFGRAGAVATAVLVAFGVADYSRRLENLRRAVYETFTRSPMYTKASEEPRAKTEVAVRDLIDETTTVIRCWYTALLFVATIVWGLGDILYALWHCETLTAWDKFSHFVHLIGP